MAHVYKMFFPGKVMGKQRPRSSRFNPGVMYTPLPTRRAEASIKFEASVKGLRPKLLGPISMRMTCYFGTPARFNKSQLIAAHEGILFPTSKPDLDNVVKMYCDALNGVAWRDDSQIVEMNVRKRYITNGAEEGVLLEFWEIMNSLAE